MPSEDIEPRVAALEGTVGTHEERITAHGREIDALTERSIRLEMRGQARDEQLARIERNQNEQSGKIDALLMKPADDFNRIRNQVIGLVVAALAAYLLGKFGLPA